MENSDFKVGDTVICKPGFKNSCNGGVNPDDGGSGYREGETFKISNFTNSTEGKQIAWGMKNGNGVYAQALELYCPETLLTKIL